MKNKHKVAVDNNIYRLNVNNAAVYLRNSHTRAASNHEIRNGEGELTKFVEVLSVCWCISPDGVLIDIANAPHEMEK